MKVSNRLTRTSQISYIILFKISGKDFKNAIAYVVAYYVVTRADNINKYVKYMV